MNPAEQEGAIEVTIIKRPIDSLSVFEITDYELEQLEKGYKRSRLLSLCAVMFTVSAALMISPLLMSSSFDTTATILTIIGLWGVGVSTTLLLTSNRSKSRSRRLCHKIRDRVPVELKRSARISYT